MIDEAVVKAVVNYNSEQDYAKPTINAGIRTSHLSHDEDVIDLYEHDDYPLFLFTFHHRNNRQIRSKNRNQQPLLRENITHIFRRHKETNL